MDTRLLAGLAATLLAYGLVSARSERFGLTAPMMFLGLGVLLGEAGLGWLRAAETGGAVHGLAEITLVLVLFTDASRIDLACLRRTESLPLRMLGIGLPLCVLLGGLTALWLLPGLGPAGALLLGAILAPTDAALGQAVVSDPRVPLRIRQTLNVESGLNDGLALPIVLIFAAMAGAGEYETTRDVAGWIRFAALQVTLGPLVGVAVGWIGGRLAGFAVRAGWMTPPFQRLAVLGLSVLAYAGAELVGGNGFMAAFIAGLTVGNTARVICDSLYEFGEAEGQLLTLLVFLVFGAVMVPEAAASWDGRAWLYALLSLTLIRMAPAALSLVGTGLRVPSMLFLSWFGPRGLASILFTLLCVEGGSWGGGPRVESIAYLTVVVCTIAHGLSASTLAARYGTWSRTLTEDHVESGQVMELPVRHRVHDLS